MSTGKMPGDVEERGGAQRKARPSEDELIPRKELEKESIMMSTSPPQSSSI